ncbi:phenylalanine--tRNA ligase subunit beta [Alkalitalea saponilacus]|uniref:Phenylalanine--tRNA ligase beta subunit n=1 Tax=Alkalitalea saponilacus TaxID=889453 RepID=A0A1T5GCM5_9BACT|nr:phenylalanine--tRNA ligase subunit beta [Alkalitalea saponilacus]ASB47930.1 phenylalanine--tRNA ligase subunit beta [Alkalitalea saponilacus]SKC06203.1 phenylalanyl-tRNA synthetase beta subunit [Alkalitalea saponilacus]
MDISYNWLKNYINTDKSPSEIAAALTALGLEVGSIEEKETVKGGLKGLVVGKVLSCQRHPNADKLSVTTVDVGTGEPLPIVCGAPNVAAGQKVVVATVGTTLYSGEESFVIKKTKIRGEASEGMICAEDEIGLGTSHDGIMVLNPETKVGTPAAEYFKIESDTIFEVDLTPNRIDGASHIGVARDLAASLQLTDPNIKVTKPSVDDFKTDNNNYPIKITVEDAEACPRYSGVTISGVKVTESPDWLKNRLLSIGMTPINNIVDITNFVLHECGQPLHAFDGDQITGDHVVVKTMSAGTKFITLDEKERTLHEKDLMICNETEGMCIAGVFGGIKSGVTEKTTRIFLESACFNPVYIRQTSRRHLLFTDASFRFERGSDPNITVYALKRAALLIKEIAGGEISSEVVDVYPNPVTDFKVDVSWKNITRLIGKIIDQTLVKKILTSLDIKITNETETGLSVAVPPYRVDVQREADVIEEILRVYGFNNVEAPTTVNSTIVYSPQPNHHQLRNEISAQLAGSGFQEIMCNSLTKSAYYDDCTEFPASRTVILANPLSSDLNGMRQTLLFGGLETIRHNRNRQHQDLKLFELGNCYFLKGNSDVTVQESYIEEQRLSLFMTGHVASANWYSPAKKASFADIKAHSENVLLKMGISPEMCQVSGITPGLLSDGLEYKTGNSVLLTIGMVKTKLLKEFDIDEAVFFAEFNWDNLVKASSRQQITYSELSRFPEVKRDLALLLDESVQYAAIEQTARKTEKNLLKRISLFDVYEGDKIGAGKKSYAVTFVLEDTSKTLTDKQIDKTMQKLTMAFERELGAKLR